MKTISTVQVRLRVTYVVISLLIAAAAVLAWPQYGFSPTEIILFAVSALAACYEERWIFDAEKELLTFRNGLLFLARQKKYRFADIAEIRVMTFGKGFRKTEYTRISVLLENGDELVIESLPTKKAARLIGIANELHGFFAERSGRAAT